MNKENNRSAAGLRRSAVAERIRLREEWSALKEIDNQPKQPTTNRRQVKAPSQKSYTMRYNNKNRVESKASSDVLCGVVALVEVGTESRALPLRAALTALGASVLPAWSPLVTHLIWAQGGCRSTRARGRALACRVVSPLWVEACACAERRLPEQAFAAATRPSDLPSPHTLKRLLKKAEVENIPIADLLSDSTDENKMPRLRISSDTSRDTSCDTSRDTTHETSRDTSRDSTKNKSNDSTDIETRVNTAPRRALPISISPAPQPRKSRRKLFTQKEDVIVNNTEVPKSQSSKSTQQKLTQKEKRDLARAEKMARRLLEQCRPTQQTNKYTHRIVLTGMSSVERRSVSEAVKSLGGKIQGDVDRWTTHVILGSCIQGDAGVVVPQPRTAKALRGAARGTRVLRPAWARDSQLAGHWLHTGDYEHKHLRKLSQKARVERQALGKQRSEYAYDLFCGMRVFVTATADQRDAAVQLLQLCGAVVVEKQTDTHEQIFENPNQTTTCTIKSQRPHDRRQNQGHALDRCQTQNKENVFDRCQENQTQAFRERQCHKDYDIKIGSENGDISSKWVFDSVAAARMRTARRYVVNTMSSSDIVMQMLEE